MVTITSFLADRFPVVTMIASASLTERLGARLAQLWQSFTEWASQPRQFYTSHVIAAALAWLITFCAVCITILGLGFGPAGVVAGSLAAAFQAFMYGGFTPAGGIFATLTSMGMLGALMPAALVLAMVLATGVAVVVWVDAIMDEVEGKLAS
ncbi:hypothetical protein C8A05DRAFT_38196 [Staphylotrichum tortipilum]|uniref:Uncharacterized protein n=1 Tax=Staphylotrichum tortipilum TaxID=2831512 RepID=A0AAN6MD27_9PEZI|nr:hypothetical protein C8A05DRAFT_38196 [Staphylotrichum longicolle]